MDIKKFSPIGYTATTEKGNKYRATTEAATMGLCSVGLGLLPFYAPLLASPKERAEVKKIKPTKIIQTIMEGISGKKMSTKTATGIYLGIVAADFLTSVTLGKYIDEEENKRRAMRADMKVSKQGLDTKA